VVLVSGQPARGAQPHPKPLDVARAANRWLDDTTVPAWLVSALIRASARLPTSDRFPSLHTASRPPGNRTDPVDALPMLLAVRRSQPKLAPAGVCKTWVERLQSRLGNDSGPDTVDDHLRWLLAITSALELASGSIGIAADRVDALRQRADRARKQFQEILPATIGRPIDLKHPLAARRTWPDWRILSRWIWNPRWISRPNDNGWRRFGTTVWYRIELMLPAWHRPVFR